MKSPTQNIESELFFIDGIAEISDNEGYRFENGKAFFGTRLGPTHSIHEGALHEIAHTVELKNFSQLLVLNFGFEIKTKIEFLGNSYSQPITWNASKLEARTILWQEVLCEVFGYKFNREDFATALQYMPDFTCIPVKGYTFNGKNYVNLNGDILQGDLKYRDKLRLQTICDYMTEQKETGIYTYENFRKRWDEVIFFLEKQPVEIINN